MFYIARFLVDVDSNYPRVLGMFMHSNVHINFRENLVPPNQAEIVIGPFERNVIDTWLERFRSVGSPFKLFVAEWDSVKDKNYFL
jgi:hypothetical protein